MTQPIAATVVLRANELQKLVGASISAALDAVFRTLRAANIDTSDPKLIHFTRIGNDAYFAGPPLHSETAKNQPEPSPES